MKTNRRRFVANGVISAAMLASTRLLGAEPAPASAPPAQPAGAAKPVRPEPNRGPRQDLELVAAFVRAGHGNLPKVREMVEMDPALVFATWDWGGGDWETALGGASHVGSRECARFLLSRGARIDAYCAAMLGQRAVVAALVEADPTIVTARGPHGYTLLYHVAISGDTAMAEALQPHLASDARDYSQALSAAVRDGHLAMTKWLFDHGTVNANQRDALGQRPLDLARRKGFSAVADELVRHGAQPSD